jgi:hypothetical protein
MTAKHERGNLLRDYAVGNGTKEFQTACQNKIRKALKQENRKAK